MPLPIAGFKRRRGSIIKHILQDTIRRTGRSHHLIHSFHISRRCHISGSWPHISFTENLNFFVLAPGLLQPFIFAHCSQADSSKGSDGSPVRRSDQTKERLVVSGKGFCQSDGIHSVDIPCGKYCAMPHPYLGVYFIHRSP